MWRCRSWVMVAALASITACGSEDADGPSSPASTSTTDTTSAAGATEPTPDTLATPAPPTTTTTTVATTTGPTIGSPATTERTAPTMHDDLDPVTTAAVADLAARLDVDPSAVTVVSDEAVTWRDGSIGCPQPGMNYTQALVDGRRIVLEAGGASYAYHAADGQPPFYCPPQRATAPIPDPRI